MPGLPPPRHIPTLTPAPWPNEWSTGSDSPLVELRAAGLGAAGVGRVQCQLGQKTLAGGIAGGDLLELGRIPGARGRIMRIAGYYRTGV